MARKPSTFHVWVGSPSREAFHDYIEEHYDREDDAPLSEFSGEYFGGWVDHDFMEYDHREAPVAVEELLGTYYSFVDAAASAARKLGIDKASTKVLVPDEPMAIQSSPGHRSKHVDLIYIGSFIDIPPADTRPYPERTDGHGSRVLELLIVGDRAYSADFDGELRRWQLLGGGRGLISVAGPTLKGPAQDIVAVPGGIAACGNNVVVWPDDEEAWVLDKIGGYQLSGLAMHPDGDTILASCVSHCVVAWSLASRSEIARFSIKHRMIGVRVDNGIVYGRDDMGYEHAWNVGDADAFDVRNIGQECWVTCGGRRFAYSEADVVNESGAVIVRHEDRVNDLMTDGTLLATASRDSTCRVFRPDGEVVAEYAIDVPNPRPSFPKPFNDPWGLERVILHDGVVLAGDGAGRVHRFA